MKIKMGPKKKRSQTYDTNRLRPSNMDTYILNIKYMP